MTFEIFLLSTCLLRHYALHTVITKEKGHKIANIVKPNADLWVNHNLENSRICSKEGEGGFGTDFSLEL